MTSQLSEIRPSQNMSLINEKIVDMLLPKVLQWMECNLEDKDYVFQVRYDLINAIEFTDDPYKIVKNLESQSWEGDRDLIDIMDEIYMLRHEAYNSLIKEWVIQHNIKPEYSVGTLVNFKIRSVSYKGEIINVDGALGEYVIFSEQYGHVRDENGTQGIRIPFEDVKPVLLS